MLNTVDRLTGADAVGVVGEGQGVGAVGSGRKLSSLLPCEGIAVVIGQRVADVIVRDGNSGITVRGLIRGQQITPVGVTVGIIIGAVQRSGNRGCGTGSSECVGLSVLNITCVIVVKDIRSAGRPVILADELSEVIIPILVLNNTRSVGNLGNVNVFSIPYFRNAVKLN